MGLFAGINGLITSIQQNRLAKRINPVDATYQASPAITNLYNAGENLYQGRMPGAVAGEQNIETNAANTDAAVTRNATSGSQALAVEAGVQGQADNAITGLATKEAQDKENRFGIYSNVSQLMAEEGNKVFQDKLRKYYDDLNYKRALQGSAMQNKASFFSGLDDTAMAVVSAFAPGGFLAKKAVGAAGSAAGGGQPAFSGI